MSDSACRVPLPTFPAKRSHVRLNILKACVKYTAKPGDFCVRRWIQWLGQNVWSRCKVHRSVPAYNLRMIQRVRKNPQQQNDRVELLLLWLWMICLLWLYFIYLLDLYCYLFLVCFFSFSFVQDFAFRCRRGACPLTMFIIIVIVII